MVRRIEAEAKPGVFAAADGVAAMDETVLLRSGPDPAFEDGDRAAWHRADARGSAAQKPRG